jgi:exopolyphosphatase / guanosine-5'-triphosphate,3'-diphosphate pyrophosphatase
VIRVAAVDIGTNSTRLLVADVDDGRVDEIHRETTITRLGEGVDEQRRLLPVPIDRVHGALSDFRRTIERLGAERTLAVATSAVRDAENGAAFLDEVASTYGFATRLLSGDEEALLMRRGVSSGRELDADTLIVDIGGGSTELILDDFHVSLDVGSVRLTERFLHSDPPTHDELDAAAHAVQDALPDLDPHTAVGVAGTITTIVALAAAPLTTETIAAQRDRLAALTVAQGRELPEMDPERAPVIVGGAVILHEVANRYRLAEVDVSERDLLDGAALAAAQD